MFKIEIYSGSKWVAFMSGFGSREAATASQKALMDLDESIIASRIVKASH